MIVEDADIPGLRERLTRKLKAHPLVQEYMRCLAFVPHRNTEPWMALGEQLVAALWVLADPNLLQFQVGDAEGKPFSNEKAAVSFASKLLCAQPYLWSEKVEALIRSSPLPPHVVDQNLTPFPLIFWSYEVAYVRDDSGYEGNATDWLLLSAEPDGLVFCFNVFVPDKGNSIIASKIHYGKRWPDDFSGIERGVAANILQKLAFIRSPHVVTETHVVPRTWRRRAPTAQGMDSLIRTVVLRREAHQAVSAHDRASIEHRHRWWVSGHYRAQWYASRKAHEVIWIAPYLKGPIGAPLLQKVYAVRR